MKRRTEKFEDRIRFNWGYHDAVQAVRNDWDKPERNFGFGSAIADLTNPEKVLANHPDGVYAHGWVAGYYDAKGGRNTESSAAAWNIFMPVGTTPA